MLPGIHQVRRYSTRDQVYRPIESASATGAAPFQSIEGLSIGVDLTVRWTVDRPRLAQMSKEFPDDLNADLVRPAVQGIVYPLFARYSVREIFSRRRAEIQQELMTELAPKLATLGLLLRGVDMGKVDLPQDYRAGMEKLLAEELETEKVRYTLQLKEAQVKQMQLEAEADKVRRQTAAEAAGEEQVIAARAQEETMKHILPFKQKQIEQRKLEAEAEKVARIRTAEGAAEARRIEAKGEADSRQKLADAEAYRLDLVGKANAGQMEREGALIAHYPAADPKDAGRQTLRQGAGHHRPDTGSGTIHRLQSHRRLDEPRRGGRCGEIYGGELTVILALAATLAIVVQDHTPLRAAPSSSATELTALWQGDVLEVRGERAGYLKVYNYRRERGGYLRSEAVRPVGLTEADAPELLAVLRFLRESPGSEALGISYGAAYLKAVPARALTAEPFDAIAANGRAAG